MRPSHLPPLLILCSVLLTACNLLPTAPLPTAAPAAPPTAAPVVQPSPILPPTAPNPVIVEVEIHETLQKPPLTLTGRYPRVDAPGDTRYDALNRAAESLVREELGHFRTELTSPAFQTDPNMAGSFMDIEYEVLYGAHGWISMLFTVHFYLSGAAHPNQYSLPLNYDAVNRQILTLDQLFKPGAPYLKVLVDYCLMDLKNQKKLDWSDNLKADDKTFRSWTVQADGLRISFDPYEVASYAAGPQKVIIPFSALKDFIHPTGPLARLVK